MVLGVPDMGKSIVYSVIRGPKLLRKKVASVVSLDLISWHSSTAIEEKVILGSLALKDGLRS